MASEYYKGTGLKIQIAITAEGFNQDEDSYNVDIYCGEEELNFTQEDMVSDGQGNYLLPLPTDTLTEGKIMMVITAFVPDSDFEGNIRKEVSAPITIGRLKELKPAVL